MLFLTLATVASAAELRFEREAVYKYELVQDVIWRSGGDDLSYRTAMIWELLVVPKGRSEDGQLLLLVVVTQIDARHHGPGSEHRVHGGGTQPTTGADDPLLGNLLALMDVPLTLSVEPTTGVVTAVEGAQGIVDKLVAANPGRAGGASPIAEQAAAAYAPERLARLWSTLLTVPREGEERVPLEAPLSGEAVRRWNGSRYSLELPAGLKPPAVLLHTSPGRVELRLEGLTGSGSVQLVDGVLRGAEGRIEAALSGSAMTQDLRQEHRIRWTLARLEIQGDSGGGVDASPDQDGAEDAASDSP